MDNPPNEPDNKKRCPFALASFLFAIASLLLWFLAAIPAIITGLIALIIIHRSKGRLTGKKLALWAISLSVISTIALFFLAQYTFALWLQDAPPIPNDYTTADFRSAPESCKQTYSLLLTLAESQLDKQLISSTGLTEEDKKAIYQSFQQITTPESFDNLQKVLLPDADKIEQAWKNAQKNRNTIQQLLQFPEIADLSQPSLKNDTNFVLNLTKMYTLYMVHASLQMQQNNAPQAIKELIEIDHLIRKFAPNARSSTAKMGCYISLIRGYQTAAFFVNHPNTSPQMIQALKNHFTPLTEEQTSLRNIYISEYLKLKESVTYSHTYANQRRKALLKQNSTFRVYRNYWDTLINYDKFIEGNYEPYKYSVWPKSYPDSMPKVSINRPPKPWDSRLYRIYNQTGQRIMAIFTSKHDGTNPLKKHLKTTQELFQILLNTRQNIPTDLKSGLTEETYTIDTEKHIIYSKGPDNEPSTKDDIKLTINPKVLVFDKTNQ